MGTRSETPGSGLWVGAGRSERPKLGRPARRSRSREVLGLRTPASASSPLRPEEEARLQHPPGPFGARSPAKSWGQTPDPSFAHLAPPRRVGPGPSPRAAAPGTAAVSTDSGPRVPPPPRPAPRPRPSGARGTVRPAPRRAPPPGGRTRAGLGAGEPGGRSRRPRGALFPRGEAERGAGSRRPARRLSSVRRDSRAAPSAPPRAPRSRRRERTCGGG